MIYLNGFLLSLDFRYFDSIGCSFCSSGSLFEYVIEPTQLRSTIVSTFKEFKDLTGLYKNIRRNHSRLFIPLAIAVIALLFFNHEKQEV